MTKEQYNRIRHDLWVACRSEHMKQINKQIQSATRQVVDGLIRHAKTNGKGL